MCFFGSRCACTSAVVVSLCLQTLQLHYLSELSYSYQWCSFLCFLVSGPSSELWSLLLSLWRRRWSRHPMCVTSGCRRRSRRTHASLFRRRRQLWVMQSFPTLVSMVAIARCPLLSLSNMTIAPYRSQTARSDRCSRTAIHPAWMMIASRESRATQTHPAFMRCWARLRGERRFYTKFVPAGNINVCVNRIGTVPIRCYSTHVTVLRSTGSTN